MSTHTVMIIDDDEDIREIVADVLSGRGYRVVTAADGAIALTKLRDVVPALILLDLNMPVMDGATFRRAQLEEPRLAAIPTVVISAVAQINKELGDLAVTERLEKPVKLAQLLRVVERYCPRPH